MKFLPAINCCGCFSVFAGVQIICALTLLVCISVIGLCSSQETLRYKGISISPEKQVLAGAWAFVGIFLAVYAGVGAVYRIEANLKLFFFYHIISLAVGAFIPLAFIVSGSLCDAVTDPDVQRMGSSFVCGFTDTFFFMWLLVVGVLHAYFAYILWSAGEEIALNPLPELGRYRAALSKVQGPPPPTKHPLNESRAIPSMPGMIVQSPAPQQVMYAPAPPPVVKPFVPVRQEIPAPVPVVQPVVQQTVLTEPAPAAVVQQAIVREPSMTFAPVVRSVPVAMEPVAALAPVVASAPVVPSTVAPVTVTTAPVRVPTVAAAPVVTTAPVPVVTAAPVVTTAPLEASQQDATPVTTPPVSPTRFRSARMATGPAVSEPLFVPPTLPFPSEPVATGVPTNYGSTGVGPGA